MNTHKIAIVQVEPVFNNLDASIEKAITLIQEAAQTEAKLVVFGETWFCGYPAWIDCGTETAFWNHAPIKEIWAQMYENGLEVDSTAFQALQNVAKEQSITLVFGANEVIRQGKGSGTLYNSAFIISDGGEILVHHRKLMPTYTEKLIHGLGDGHGLRAVDTPIGRVGTLICWEHWMPLTRQAMHDEAEGIHFGLWPKVKEMNQVASHQYAFEGRCIVVAVGQILRKSSIPSSIKLNEEARQSDSEFLLNGGSCVYLPDGKCLLAPQYDIEEILYVDLPDVQQFRGELMNLAVSGHYQRPDVFNLEVNKKRVF